MWYIIECVFIWVSVFPNLSKGRLIIIYDSGLQLRIRKFISLKSSETDEVRFPALFLMALFLSLSCSRDSSTRRVSLLPPPSFAIIFTLRVILFSK